MELFGPLLRLSDKLVGWSPAPLRKLLRRPLGDPSRSTDSAAASVVTFTVRVSVAAFTLLCVLHLVDLLALDGRWGAFDADDDQSIWSWMSIAAEAATAVVLGLLCAGSRRKKALSFSACTVLFLSLDDFIRIHEQLGSVFIPFPEAVRVLWPAFYLPLLAGLMIVLWRVAEGEADAEKALVRGGLLALVLAVGLEVISPAFIKFGGYGSPGYEIEVALEEALELCGWIWISGGLGAAMLLGRQPPESQRVTPPAVE